MAFNMINATTSNTNNSMDNLEDNAKVSDSAYSNSCSNSQARSRSSQSTHSGSHSSGSSGYGGKPSTSGYSSNKVSQPPEIRCKVKKKKKQPDEIETIQEEKLSAPEPEPEVEPVKEVCVEVVSSPIVQQDESAHLETLEVSTTDRSSASKDKASTCTLPVRTPNRNLANSSDGFSCIISMQDGVVMYTTNSLTNSLGFPRDMWIGRSFIDFVHPRDRNTFASQITNGLVIPKNVNGTNKKGNTLSTMVCRIRRYRGLATGFGVKDRVVAFMPFLLKLSFRNICDEEGDVIYLLLQATPLFPAYKTSNEILSKAVPFVIRHAANGDIKYIDPESVPYLGYSPQDIVNKDALHLYHPHDLTYLRQVYETIVKQGGVPRSKPYRMMAQNGDYVKLETEWSSFINPWSRKLEFVIGKHLLIEGPTNPDVFQTAEITVKFTEEEKNKAQSLRENIVRAMNEILTKPAEAAKQQMTKRCQDLASFMESLIDEAPKTDDEMWLDIKEPDSAYYDFSIQERDSVMLGGISPHHDCDDSKSSTETQISYNQLNYNETLQRYFISHLPYSEDGNSHYGTNKLTASESKSNSTGPCLSPTALNSGGSADMSSSESSTRPMSNSSPLATLGNYSVIRLTESALSKHNSFMEKELMKMHREIKFGNKEERKKSSKESRLKKKEHLARCNASFLPTSAGLSTVDSEPHSLKRSSRQSEENSMGYKHRYSTAKLPRHNENHNAVRYQTQTTSSNAFVSSQLPSTAGPGNNMNTFFLGMPPQVSLMSPVPTVPGILPVCYMPATPQRFPIATPTQNEYQNSANQQYSMPCVMYGQPVYGPPLLYSPVNAQMQQMQQVQQMQQLQQMQQMQQMQQIQQMQQMQQGFMAQNFAAAGVHPLGLPSGNYQEACKLTFPMKNKSMPPAAWKEKQRTKSLLPTDKKGSGGSHSSAAVSLLSANSVNDQRKGKGRLANSEDTIDKTDEESSYSSFYSNFFKSESGSAEESDVKKRILDTTNSSETNQVKKSPRRKMEPPWMENVCVTSELIYKYQVKPKDLDEVLLRDRKKLDNMEQPSLVNDQLGQLYLDLQLEGVATRLTLEENITSSSSSGEESFVRSSKVQVRRRKREYSRLVMIYEEDAPLPSPDDAASSSTS